MDNKELQETIEDIRKGMEDIRKKIEYIEKVMEGIRNAVLLLTIEDDWETNQIINYLGATEEEINFLRVIK